MEKNEQFDQLVQKIAPQSKLLRIWPLKGGISAGMTALEVEYPDGKRQKMILRQPGEAALKQNPHAAEDEFKVLQVTHQEGLATPNPILLDSSGKIFSSPYLVIEYIEGGLEFSPTHIKDYMSQFAIELARIHRLDCSRLDLSFLPEQPGGFDENFGKRPEKENQSLEEGRIRDTLETAWPLVQKNTPVMLHGDFWPGNILWHDGRLAAVIDWEDARLGEPLIDLAISRLDILWIFGIEAFYSFTDAYKSRMAIDYTNLPYWDLSAALRLVRMAGADLMEWAAFFAPYGRQDITENTIRKYYRFFISQAVEKLARL
jgi:aminoglycoside phosphotransferase (APT) family kinase protein